MNVKGRVWHATGEVCVHQGLSCDLRYPDLSLGLDPPSENEAEFKPCVNEGLARL